MWLSSPPVSRRASCSSFGVIQSILKVSVLPLIAYDPRLHLANRLDVWIVVPGSWLPVRPRQVVAVIHVREGALRATRLLFPVGLGSFMYPIRLHCQRVALVVDLFEIDRTHGLILGRQAGILFHLLHGRIFRFHRFHTWLDHELPRLNTLSLVHFVGFGVNALRQLGASRVRLRVDLLLPFCLHVEYVVEVIDVDLLALLEEFRWFERWLKVCIIKIALLHYSPFLFNVINLN